MTSSPAVTSGELCTNAAHAHYEPAPRKLGCPACGTHEHVITWINCPNGRIVNWLCDRCWLFAQCIAVEFPQYRCYGVETSVLLSKIGEEHGSRQVNAKLKKDRSPRKIREVPARKIKPRRR